MERRTGDKQNVCIYVKKLIYEIYERKILQILDSNEYDTKSNNMKEIISSFLMSYMMDDLNTKEEDNTKYVSFCKNDKLKYILILMLTYARNYRLYRGDGIIGSENGKNVLNIKEIWNWKEKIDKKMINDAKRRCDRGYCYCTKTRDNLNTYDWTIAAYMYNIDGDEEDIEYDIRKIFNLKKYYNRDICPFIQKFKLEKKIMNKKYNEIKDIINKIPLDPESAIAFALFYFNKMIINDNPAIINTFDIEDVTYYVMFYVSNIFKYTYMMKKKPTHHAEVLIFIDMIRENIINYLSEKCRDECVCEYSDEYKEKIQIQNAFRAYTLSENQTFVNI